MLDFMCRPLATHTATFLTDTPAPAITPKGKRMPTSENIRTTASKRRRAQKAKQEHLLDYKSAISVLPPHQHKFEDPYDEAIYELIRATTSTKKYSTGRNKHWIPFRQRRGKEELMVPGEDLENINEVCRFMMYFVLEAPGVNSFKTVEQYMLHVKDMHATMMFTPQALKGEAFIWPSDYPDSRYSVLKRKIQQWFAETPQEEGGRLPFTPSLLKEMIDCNAINLNSHNGKRTFCLILMTILGGFRMGELLPKTIDPEKRNTFKDCKVKDVHLSKNTITVKVLSKTTKDYESVNIHVSEMNVLIELFGAEFDVMKILQDITQDASPDRLLFVRADGLPFTYNYFMVQLRKATDAMKIPRGYLGGHSGRIYLASLLALQNVKDSYIQKRGRWKSKAFKMYVRSLDLREFTSQEKITHFKLSNLTFVLQGFPNSPEFQRATL